MASAGAAGRQLREADLDGHFTHADAKEDEPPVSGESASDSDVQLTRAVEVLKSWTYFERLRNGENPSTLHARSKDEEPATATP